MSLINNMLKDLEKRKNNHTEAPIFKLTSLPKPEREFPLNKLILGIAVLALVVACVYQLTQRKSHTLAPMLNAQVDSQQNTKLVSETDWLKPTAIKGITLEVKDNITELTFLLDHQALYHLDTHDMTNRFSLVIEGSKLESSLPPTAYLSNAIRHFDVEQRKYDTQFDFELASDATVKYVNLNTENKNPELVIAIENSSNKPNQPTSSEPKTVAVKTQAIQSLLSQRYHTALTAAENGQYENAIQQLTQLLDVDPSYKDVRVSLAALLIDQGQTALAKRIIDGGLKFNANYLPFIELKARILTQQGNVQSALALLQSLTPPISENPEYHAFIAALYERTNNNTMAVSLYQKLVALNAHNGNWWFGLGVSLDKLGQQRSASDAYTRAINEGHLTPESLIYVQNRLKSLQEGVNEKS